MIYEKDFLKYLFLNLSIIKGKSINMIIDTLIYNFNEDETFQKNFCAAAEYSARIRDYLEKEELQISESPRESNIRASLLRQDFCSDLLKNKVILKIMILKHFKTFIEFITQKEKNKANSNLRKEIIDILKEFLKNTFSEIIITRVSNYFENLRPIWKENWVKGKLDFEIEESMNLTNPVYP